MNAPSNYELINANYMKFREIWDDYIKKSRSEQMHSSQNRIFQSI